MEDQNKNQSSSANNKADEEKEILKGAKILVRDQEGKFDYLEGSSLMGEKQKTVTQSTPIEHKEEIKQVTASQVRPSMLDLKKPSEKMTANFYFDAEDEEEIQRMNGGKIGQATTVIDYNSIVQEIAEQTGISLPDEFLKKRFSSLITSRLRDIRTSIQLKELLVRSKKVGGLELADDQADQVVHATEEKAKSIHDQDTIKELEERKKKKEAERIQEEEQSRQMRQAVAREQIKKAVQKLQQQKQTIIPPPPTPPPPKPKRKPLPSPSIPKVKRPTDGLRTKPKIVDIKTPSRLLGPIEEIKSLTVVDFRRLAPMPREATKKIKEKIELLEEESFTRKAEAIQAWKQSEIYQLYLDIGNEGMNKGKSVKEIISSRTIDGRSCLTEEEFKVVGDLNKQLRF